MVVAKWQVDAKNKINRHLEKYKKLIGERKTLNSNEAQTRQVINWALVNMFGYDDLEEITPELNTRNEFADYAIKIKGEFKFMIETKRAAIKLNAHHLDQIVSYTIENGIGWVLITNGSEFRFYKIANASPLVKDLVFSIDIFDEDKKKSEIVEDLFLLSRPAVIHEFPLINRWKQSITISDASICEALVSDKVLNALRTVLKSKTGFLVNADDIRKKLKLMFSE
ncbi:MAG: type I restriction enzyme HsdR N-terminal domain-containing protein [Bifidobacteriaceae bacterium]|jgi:predicted type IV restriction endonuclease|nr:type I restriction enzyme HsdR N-terminal domain-containing protein [Bifidobacteriaceae bacterium]